MFQEHFTPKMSTVQYESDDNSEDEQKYEEDEEDDSDGDESGEEEDSEEEEDDEDVARGQLSDISFGELHKLKETIGLKKYNDVVFGPKKVDPADNSFGKALKRKVENGEGLKPVEAEKKKMKSEPEEMSSKKHKNKPRSVVENVRRRHRDPRFDNLSGTFNEDLFQKSYGFVDALKKEELQTVKKKFKKAKGKEEKAELHKLLQRMEEQEKMNDQKAKRREIEKKRKKEEYEGRSAGKKVFYMKKSDSRKLELVDEYKKLKASGKIDKVLNRKRKMNASKEKKKFVNM